MGKCLSYNASIMLFDADYKRLCSDQLYETFLTHEDAKLKIVSHQNNATTQNRSPQDLQNLNLKGTTENKNYEITAGIQRFPGTIIK